jgi:predicted DCC family thiol-disulfide oxidoreductase YuxK
MMESDKQIILFDGICNLCNGAIQYVIKRDTKDMYRFAAIQSTIGQKLLKERTIDPSKIDSIILIEPTVAYYIKSDAALKIGRSFGGGYKLLSIFSWIPRVLRDMIYDLIAKNRYRWFGKKEACMIPTPELQSKFLS